MQFKPRTEEEIQLERLLVNGIYPFTVKTAMEKQSKKGNDMIALELLVHTPDRGDWTMKDWLLEKFAMKLVHFCRHLGLEDKYKDGTLTAEDCNGRQGWCHIITEPAQGTFGPQNRIEDYVEKPDGAAKAEKTDDLDSDDIPF